MKQYYVATCGACFRTQRVRIHPNGDTTMVLHGYDRPGDGQTHGQCYGAYEAPYELTSKVTERFKHFCENQKDVAEQQLKIFPPNPSHDPKSTWQQCRDYRQQYPQVERLESHISELAFTIGVCESRIENWTLGEIIDADQIPRTAKTAHICKVCDWAELKGSFTDASLIDGVEFRCPRCERYNLKTKIDMTTIMGEEIITIPVEYSKTGRLKLLKAQRKAINEKLESMLVNP